MSIDCQSPVIGASNVVVENTDLTAARAYGACGFMPNCARHSMSKGASRGGEPIAPAPIVNW
jgi:hypothetical protein